MEVDRGLSPESDESDEQDARNDRILDEVERLLHRPSPGETTMPPSLGIVRPLPTTRTATTAIVLCVEFFESTQGSAADLHYNARVLFTSRGFPTWSRRTP
jgi:hypothetical protein